jgi:hypothetical protein
MSEPDDVLNRLARLQDQPARSARDLAVLEAARSQAAMVRQKAIAPTHKRNSVWDFVSKPMWLGTGSLAAAFLSVFIVFGSHKEPESKRDEIASAPVAVSAPSPAAEPVAKAETAAPTQEPVSVAKQVTDRGGSAKREQAVKLSKPVVVADVAIAEQSKMTPERPVIEASSMAPATTVPAPLAVAAPAPATVSPPLLSAPSGKVAAAAAAPAFDGQARKREVTSNLNAPDTCLADIKAIPIDRQSLSVEATKQLIERCGKNLSSSSLPSDIAWAKKLFDVSLEKSLLKSTEKPQ